MTYVTFFIQYKIFFSQSESALQLKIKLDIVYNVAYVIVRITSKCINPPVVTFELYNLVLFYKLNDCLHLQLHVLAKN